MGRRLIAAGWPVTAFDVAETAMGHARNAGAAAAVSARAVAADAQVVITMLSMPAAVSAAASGPEGLLAGLHPGAMWLEMSSSHPSVTRDLATQVGSTGAAFVDAPVTGGVVGAEEGTLTIMVGGAAADLDRVRPVLDVLGDSIFHVGDRPGDGDLAKTLNNLLSATNLTAAAEALSVGARSGLDVRTLVGCIAAGTGASHAVESKIPAQILTGRFAAGFTIREYLKDLDIAVDVAASLGTPLLVGSVAQQTWLRLASSGFGDEDHSRVVALIAKEAGAVLEDT